MKYKAFSIFLTSILLFTSISFVSAKNNYKKVAKELLSNFENTKKSIAVAQFSYSDGRTSMDGVVVSERLITEIIKLKKFIVVERKELEKVLQELKLEKTGLVDLKSAKNIGKILGADFIILGTLTEVPNKKLELNIRMVSVDSGIAVNAVSSKIKKDWLSQYRKILVKKTKNIENNPKSAEAFYERGLINHDLEEYDKAIADFGIAITLKPKYGEAYLQRGAVYVSKWKLKKSLKDLNRASELMPLSSKVYCYIGFAYTFMSDFSKAIENYNKAIQINPDSEIAYLNRGIAFWRNGNIESALKDFTYEIKRNPVDSSSYANRCGLYVEIKEYDKAIKDCTKVLKNNLDPSTAYSNRALAYKRKGEYKKAIADYNSSIKNNPNDAFAYDERGQVYALKSKVDLAIKDFNKAIKLLQPGLPEHYYHRATTYQMKGDYTRAMIDYTNAISNMRFRRDADSTTVYPEYSEILVARGTLYYRVMKDYDKAIADYSQALLLHPNNIETLAYRSHVYTQKRDYRKGGAMDKAIADMDRAIEIKPNDAGLYLGRGIQYGAWGYYFSLLNNKEESKIRYKKALNDYNMAVKLNPSLHNKVESDIQGIMGKISAMGGM